MHLHHKCVEAKESACAASQLHHRAASVLTIQGYFITGVAAAVVQGDSLTEKSINEHIQHSAEALEGTAGSAPIL